MALVRKTECFHHSLRLSLSIAYLRVISTTLMMDMIFGAVHIYCDYPCIVSRLQNIRIQRTSYTFHLKPAVGWSVGDWTGPPERQPPSRYGSIFFNIVVSYALIFCIADLVHSAMILIFGAIVGLLSLIAIPFALSIPLDPPVSATQVVWITAVVTSEIDVLATSTLIPVPPSTVAPPTPAPTVVSGSPLSTSSTYNALSTTTDSVAASGTVNVAEASTSMVTVTDVLFVTATATATPQQAIVTTTQSPPTVTDTITVAPTSSVTPSGQTIWAPSPHFTDLSSFNIISVPYGLPNMQIVAGIPAAASATATSTAFSAESTSHPSPPPPTWDNSSSALQLLYPANSINPGSDPQGGSDFYATPLDLSHSQNVTLEYSVFFPVDFDWVLAGKLPGIYGGHAGCSGGDAAITCFSTRLMWRPGGAGELYLVRVS